MYRRANNTPTHHRFRFAKPQVRQFAPVRVVKKDVFQLDISMHQSLRVEETNSLHYVQRHTETLQPTEIIQSLGLEK